MSNHVSQPNIKFSQSIGREFDGTLKKRVRDYFKDNNISKHANLNMVFKTVFMISLYLVPFILMLSGVITNIWLIALCWVIMGVAMAGIGMAVMHDANHGAYSKNETVNMLIGRVIGLIGGFAANWKIQHNILHHSYTNVDEYDEDISAPISWLRFSPNTEHKKAHKFQYLYAWFFYGFMTISWMTLKDFLQLSRYKKKGLTETQSKKFYPLLIELIINKIIYYGVFIVLPIILIDISWWYFPIFIFMMHFVAGFILAIVFQLAHVVPDAAFVKADENNAIENNWAIHQLQTTVNFAPKSHLLYWFVGGLNFQVEHHLFPNICHVHYKKISQIVKDTAKEFGIPYYSEPTFASALASHTRMLKQLGKA